METGQGMCETTQKSKLELVIDQQNMSISELRAVVMDLKRKLKTVSESKIAETTTGVGLPIKSQLERSKITDKIAGQTDELKSIYKIVCEIISELVI